MRQRVASGELAHGLLVARRADLVGDHVDLAMPRSRARVNDRWAVSSDLKYGSPTMSRVSTCRAVPRLRCSSPASRSTMVIREVSATRPRSTPRTVAWARQSQPEPPWLGWPMTSSVRFSAADPVAIDEVLDGDLELEPASGPPHPSAPREGRAEAREGRGAARRQPDGEGQVRVAVVVDRDDALAPCRQHARQCPRDRRLA